MSAIYQDHNFANHFALYEMANGESIFWDNYLNEMADKQFVSDSSAKTVVKEFFKDVIRGSIGSMNYYPDMKPADYIW